MPGFGTLRSDRTYQVQCRAGLEPLDLALVETVCKRNLLLRAIAVLEHEREVLTGRKRLEAEDIDPVIRADLLVVGGIGEREREHTLLLQVRLVDTGEGAGDDSKTTEEAGLESGVLTRRTLTVVVVTDDDPLDAVVTVVGGGLGNSAELACDLVLDLVSLAVLGVDGTDQAVFYTEVNGLPNEIRIVVRTGDVLEVATVLEPGTASRDVIRR